MPRPLRFIGVIGKVQHGYKMVLQGFDQRRLESTSAAEVARFMRCGGWQETSRAST
jgi:hypothetical protein